MNVNELSKDYSRLFSLICNGMKMPVYVDYHFRPDSEPIRDLCAVERRKAYDIYIGVRGLTYGSVYPFDKKRGSEMALFISECARLNLEFFDCTLRNSASSACLCVARRQAVKDFV